MLFYLGSDPKTAPTTQEVLPYWGELYIREGIRDGMPSYCGIYIKINLVDVLGIEPRLPYGTGLQSVHDPYVTTHPLSCFLALPKALISFFHFYVPLF